MVILEKWKSGVSAKLGLILFLRQTSQIGNEIEPFGQFALNMNSRTSMARTLMTRLPRLF